MEITTNIMNDVARTSLERRSGAESRLPAADEISIDGNGARSFSAVSTKPTK